MFGLALAAFLAENLVRRLLMAVLRFWRVVALDTGVLVGTLGWVLVASLRAGPLELRDVLVALLLGQVVGIAVGVALLPATERWWGDWNRHVGAVVSFGSWRAGQQSVRPTSMFAVRVLVVAAVGAAVFGQLEAARVYTAPAMLLANGAATFFLASFASRAAEPLPALRRRADLGAAALAAALGACGIGAVVLLPLGSRLVSDGTFELSALAVVGWITYAWGCAVTMPYASLATVRGRHVLMVGMRLVEVVLSIAAVALVLALDASVDWVPLALAAGPVTLVPLIRRLVRTRCAVLPAG